MPNDRRKILRAIKQEARYIPDQHAQRVFKKYAVEIPLVEVGGLRNPQGGDQDSTNLRQERAKVYGSKWAKTGGSQNIPAIVRRLREEFQQQYQPGEKSYDVAAQVQRPAAQYRGRYKDVAGQASKVLAGSGAEPNTNQGSSTTSYRTTPGVDNSDLRQQAKQAYVLGNMHDPNTLLTLASSLRQAQDTPGTRTKIQPKPYQGSTKNKTGSALVDAAKAEADHIDQAHVSYLYGGGHGAKQARGSKVTPIDCSAAVSRVLGIDPRVSGEFEKWGKPGRGRVTVYSNEHHVLMEINGHFFGTSGTNPGGGAGWIKRKDIPKGYLSGFVARHA